MKTGNRFGLNSEESECQTKEPGFYPNMSSKIYFWPSHNIFQLTVKMILQKCVVNILIPL